MEHAQRTYQSPRLNSLCNKTELICVLDMLTDLIVKIGRAAQRLSDGSEESIKLATFVLTTANSEFQRIPLWSFMPQEPDWRKRTEHLPNGWLSRTVLKYEA